MGKLKQDLATFSVIENFLPCRISQRRQVVSASVLCNRRRKVCQQLSNNFEFAPFSPREQHIGHIRRYCPSGTEGQVKPSTSENALEYLPPIMDTLLKPHRENFQNSQ